MWSADELSIIIMKRGHLPLFKVWYSSERAWSLIWIGLAMVAIFLKVIDVRLRLG